MAKDWSTFVKDKINNYKFSDIRFTKVQLLGWLEQRNKSTIQELKNEVYTSGSLKFVEKQEVTFKGKLEIRYRCYHLFSGSRGRCFVLTFSSNVNIVTVFPLGRKTLSKYGKRFK